MIKNIINFFKKSTVLILILSFFGLNIVFSFVNLKLDLSSGKAYSLSSSTEKILKKLKDNLEISFYVSSSDLPSRLIPLKNEVVDFLNEYQRASKKVKVKILDPKKDTKAQDEVDKLGIPEFQYSQLEKDAYQVKKIYFSIVVKYKDKTEIIYQANDLDNLEYNITSLIYKLTSDKQEKIAVIGKKEVFGLGEETDDLATLKKILRQQYEVNFFQIDKDSPVKEIDKNYKLALIFDDNQKTYQDEEIEKIKSYLNNGGQAIFFVDGVWVDKNSLYVSKANHNLNGLLADYGVKVNENLILSLASEMVNFGSTNYQFITNYPYWIKTNNFNKKYSLFSNVNILTFPWVSSVDFQKNGSFEKEVLVSSIDKSWQQKYSTSSAMIVSPENIIKPSASDLKTFPLIAGLKKNNQLKIVVIPSSRFVYDQFSSQNNNLEFVFNLVDNMISSGALSGIKSRSVNFYTLPALSDNQKDIVRYSSILLLPVIFGFYGFLRIFKRAKE
ncbi:MAG: hypothetical protein KatS3mg092_0222 [Patescibacteria group bacterium]|nr:MAG: hypothetical protein KatS3mg092_0222 [Patescibacteria group bacterium]